MNKLLKFDEYKIIKECDNQLDTYFDNINESVGAAIGSPVKFTKLRNNAKKYQQALVQKALNSVNYEKKKQAAGQGSKEETQVLKAATAAKNQALTDKASAIADRMDQLATTDPLKAVKSLAKSKAKIAAAETSLKVADAEETKELKIKIKNLASDVSKKEKLIKDYEKDKPDKDKEVSNTETSADKPDKDKEATKTETSVDKPNVDKEATKTETAAEKKERERKNAISKKIEDAMIAISKAEFERKTAEENKNKLSKQLDNTTKGTPEENQLSKEVSSAAEAVKDIENEIEKLKNNIKELRDELKK